MGDDDMEKLIIIAILVFTISSCASQQIIGTGPIELTPSQQRYHEQYLKTLEEKREGYATWALAVSPTENYAAGAYLDGYRGHRAGRSEVQKLALRLCNEKVKAKDCKIYDINGEVVWKFDSQDDKTTPPTSENDIYQGRKILLLNDFTLRWGGKEKYKAKTGDVLTIIRTQPCIFKKSIDCWIVEHDEHGIGAMRADERLLTEGE